MGLNAAQQAILDAAKKKKSSGKKSTPEEYDPYAEAATGYGNILKKYGFAPEEAVYEGSVAGQQAGSTLGTKKGRVPYEKWQKLNQWYLDERKEKGLPDYNPDKKEDVLHFQKRFRDVFVEDAEKAFTARGQSPEEARKNAIAMADEVAFKEGPGYKGSGDPRYQDTDFGDWTRSRARFKFSPLEKEKPGPLTKKETPAVIDPGPEAEDPAGYTHQSANAPWWIQDVINTAAAAGNRFGLKKYLPWAPQVHLQTPRATFYDPTRELAASNEAYNIGANALGTFAGPQVLSGRLSKLQGDQAKTAANILGNYHNKNVTVANQFENLKTDILNKNTMLNADTARKLYDQTTVANQQFDNAKRQANNEIRESYVNALTNRAMTQTMNTLYPHYQIDPMRGGSLDFYKGNRPVPSATQDLSQQIASAKKIAAENDLDFRDVLDYMGKGRSQDRRRDSMPEYDDPSNLSAAELERQDWLRQRGVTRVGPYGGYTG